MIEFFCIFYMAIGSLIGLYVFCMSFAGNTWWEKLFGCIVGFTCPIMWLPYIAYLVIWYKGKAR